MMFFLAYLGILPLLYSVTVSSSPYDQTSLTKRALPEPIPDLNVTPSPEHSNSEKSEEQTEKHAILALSVPSTEERQGLVMTTKAGRKKVWNEMKRDVRISTF